MLHVHGSGTNSVFHETFSEELLTRLTKVQETLLKKAVCLINPGSTIVYATCSILKEENEKILEVVKEDVEIIPIEKIACKNINFLSSQYGTLTICPNFWYEGFFVAKLRKK